MEMPESKRSTACVVYLLWNTQDSPLCVMPVHQTVQEANHFLLPQKKAFCYKIVDNFGFFLLANPRKKKQRSLIVVKWITTLITRRAPSVLTVDSFPIANQRQCRKRDMIADYRTIGNTDKPSQYRLLQTKIHPAANYCIINTYIPLHKAVHYRRR